MSIQTRTCVVVTCDTCGGSPECDDFEEVHYQDSAAAVAELAAGDYPWQIDEPTGAARCGACRARAECEHLGHQWSPWTTPRSGRAFRWCERCPDEELRPVEDVPDGAL